MRHALMGILLLVVASANAATVVYSSPGVVTGIGGLDINGTLYNVDFEATGSAFTTFGGEVDFWSTANEAITAGSAINAILNLGEGLEFPILLVNNSLLTYYQIFWGDPSFAAEENQGGGSFPWVGTGGIPQEQFLEFSTSWSVVPLPAAVWLFGSALAGLGWLRRRRTA